MIEKIHIENFKSLKDVTLKLGGLNLFIGANASGKSNFFDALRVLQGIGYGFTFREILDGKPKSATGVEWEPIRGGSLLARFQSGGQPPDESIRFTVEVNSRSEGDGAITYAIGFNPITGQVTEESLRLNGNPVFNTEWASNDPYRPVILAWYDRPGVPGPRPHLEFDRSRPILGQLSRHRDVIEEHIALKNTLVDALANTQRIDPMPEILRNYAQPQQIRQMGEHGENFAALVKTICEDPTRKEAFTSWLRELRPSEVDEVTTMEGALHEPLFALQEGGKKFPAPVLSDGTLRFAAITAAFFQPDMPATLTIEEIEKGIHASRLRLLLELLKSQAGREHPYLQVIEPGLVQPEIFIELGGTKLQVMATTHSRSVLDWLGEEDYPTTFFCHRNPQTSESRIVPLSEVPHLIEVAKTEPLGDLFAENWMEAVL